MMRGASGPEFVGVEHANARYANVTKLEWFIGLRCNFSCTYCAEHVRSGFGDGAKIMKAVDLLQRKIVGRKIELLLGGGEPSIHPQIEEICAHIHEKGIHLMMITNGAKSPDLYVRMLRHIKHYSFSLHLEMPYERTLSSILAVRHEIQKHKARGEQRTILVHLVMAAGHFDEVKKAMELFDKSGVTYILRRVRPLFDEGNRPILPKKVAERKVVQRDYQKMDLSKSDWGYYTNEELDFLASRCGTMSKNSREFWSMPGGGIDVRASSTNDILIRKDNRFQGWNCYVGIERLHIYPNGDVYRSTCKVGGKLGNVYGDFEFPEAPILCTKIRCTCAWAVNISKIKRKGLHSLLRVAEIN